MSAWRLLNADGVFERNLNLHDLQLVAADRVRMEHTNVTDFHTLLYTQPCAFMHFNLLLLMQRAWRVQM